MSEISRLKRKAEVEVCCVHPGDWSPPVAGVFKKETMNNLADLGEKMGADPASWSDEPPGVLTTGLKKCRNRDYLVSVGADRDQTIVLKNPFHT